MTNTGSLAIHAVGLSKQYRVVMGATLQHLGDGPTVVAYRTLRESLAELVRRSLRRSSAREDGERFYALRDVDLDVPAGTVVGIIGRNGAGKSTLLKILSRITDPSAGYAEIYGRVGSLLEVGTGFHPELTGRENIFLAGTILGMRRSEITRRFDEIVGFAEVGRFVDTPLKRFSSGMYLRLAFAVASHLDTEIMLVDEVLAVGDLQFRLRCLGKMREVSRGGRTVLFVSHDMSSIRQLCERVVWLDHGRIVEDGPAVKVVGSYEEVAYRAAVGGGGVFLRPVDETKDKLIWFSQVETRNERDEPTSTFIAGETLRLVMMLDGQAPADAFTIEWAIQNERGERAAYGTANPQQDVYFDRKDRVIECAIGPLWLTSGRYRLWLSISVAKWYRWDLWEDAATFGITLADAFGTGFDANALEHGVVVVPHRWRVLKTEKAPAREPEAR